MREDISLDIFARPGPASPLTQTCTKDDKPASRLRSGFGVVRFTSRQTIFKQGEPSSSLLEILTGSAMRVINLPDGRRQVLDVLDAGKLLGLPLQSHQMSDVIAVGDVRARRISNSEFVRSYRLQGLAHIQLLKQFCHMQELLVSIGKRSACERIAGLLKTITIKKHGPDVCLKSNHQPLEISLGITQTDIADHLGLRLETVCREFANLKKLEIIRPKGRSKMFVLDAARLSRRAAGRAECDVGEMTDKHQSGR